MNEDAKKVTMKSGKPLDDDKLETVSGGNGNTGVCPNNISGHEFQPKTIIENGEVKKIKVCRWCGQKPGSGYSAFF